MKRNVVACVTSLITTLYPLLCIILVASVVGDVRVSSTEIYVLVRHSIPSIKLPPQDHRVQVSSTKIREIAWAPEIVKTSGRAQDHEEDYLQIKLVFKQ